MKIKTYSELRLRDLPRIESPFLAASRAATLINHSPTRSLRMSDGQQMSQPMLEQELREGRLFLVSSSAGLDKPINPAVRWESSGSDSGGGQWRLSNAATVMARLERNVRTLNEWEVTPDSLNSVGSGGMGHLQAAGFDATMTERRADDRLAARQNADKQPSLPLGAASAVAPLASAANRTVPLNDEAQEPKRKPVHLEVGIFLDGTLNNAGNIDIFKQRVEAECLAPRKNGEIDDEECERRLALLMGASYANGTSNVAKLSDLYSETKFETDSAVIHRFPVYTPGAGSKTGAPDSLWGMATGLGETGVIEQVNSTFNDFAEQAAPRIGDGLIDELTVDLFGFSRGAAAGRHAANDVSIGAEGMLGKKLAKIGIKWPRSVKIRFIGLFDTVGGIVNISGGDLSAANSKNAPVNLYLAPNIAEAVVHFTAIDECRENFALNSLRASDGSLPDNFREFILPGAHSDIGGGYHETATEEVSLHSLLTIEGSATAWPEKTIQWDNLAALAKATKAAGWIGPQCLPLSNGEAASLEISKKFREHPAPDGRVDLDLKMKRKVLGELSHVYLHCMYDLAKQIGVPFEKMDPSEDSTLISDELNSVYKVIFEAITDGNPQPYLTAQQIALLKQRYIHHSDNFNLIEFLVGDTILRAEPPLNPMRPAPNRQRIIHANHAERILKSHATTNPLEVSHD